MNKRILWLVIGLLCLCVCGGILGTLGYLGMKRVPGMNSQVPPGSTPIQVSIDYPESQKLWPMNASIPVTISAWGARPITEVDLYINNTLYKSVAYPEGRASTEYYGMFQWQPGQVGKYILVARATDAEGGTGISGAVMIESGEAVGYLASTRVNQGDTLQSLANQQDVSLEDVEHANPGVDPGQTLSAGDQVFLPQAPSTEINNPVIPAFTPETVPPTGGTPPTNGGGTQQWNFIHNMFFWIKNSLGNNQNSNGDLAIPHLPVAPVIGGSVSGCGVSISLNSSNSNNQDGFFIYRSVDGGKFKRIATLAASNSGGKFVYLDQDQKGLVTYYASAFNGHGESASQPVTIPLNEIDCGSTGSGGSLGLDEERNLVLPNNLDTAYVYLQLNHARAIRVPEGDRMFLPGSGQKFNLRKTLDSLVDTVQIPDMHVHLEVWGWQAGELVYVGSIDQDVHRPILTICSMEGAGACTGGGGGKWVREMNLVSNDIKPLDQQSYEIRWQTTSLSEADTVCLGLAEKFKDVGILNANSVLMHRCYFQTATGYVGGTEGTYLLDLGQVLYPADKSNVKIFTGDYSDNFEYRDFDNMHPQGEPFDLLLRSLIELEDDKLDDYSNTVFLHYRTGTQANELPALASDVPSLYDIQILRDTYVAPTFEIWENWAAVMVDSDPSGRYDPGTILRPLGYVECGVNVDCEDPGFWGTVGMVWDMIADAYNDAKNAIIGAVADVIPYCNDSSLCQDAIKAGIDYGLTALTGMPPNLPNYDELLAQGVTEVVVGQLGDISDPSMVEYVCGDSCKTEISAQLKPYLDQAKSFYSQPGCFEPNAHYGMFPFCVPPPAIVHALEGSADFPGYVVVRITRKNTPESVSAKSADVKDKVKILLNVNGENSARMGYYASSCKYIDQMTVDMLPDPTRPDDLANFWYHYLGDQTMSGPLYDPVEFTVPWLEPGESIDIPVKLKQLTGVHPGNCIMTADIQYLFYRGTSHMAADEYCYSSGSSVPWVPCTNGGSDRWDFANPTEPGEVIKYDSNGNPVANP
jgi:LysM repeat protein